MSDEFDDDLDGDDEAGSQLVRDLRKQLKAAKKEAAEAAAIASEFRAAQRQTSVAEALKAKGADPRFAEFYAGEDSSEEAVNAWITSRADLFGIDTSDPVDEGTARAAAAISQASANAPAPNLGTPADLNARLAGAKSREEYSQVLAEIASLAAAKK